MCIFSMYIQGPLVAGRTAVSALGHKNPGETSVFKKKTKKKNAGIVSESMQKAKTMGFFIRALQLIRRQKPAGNVTNITSAAVVI